MKIKELISIATLCFLPLMAVADSHEICEDVTTTNTFPVYSPGSCSVSGESGNHILWAGFNPPSSTSMLSGSFNYSVEVTNSDGTIGTDFRSETLSCTAHNRFSHNETVTNTEEVCTLIPPEISLPADAWMNDSFVLAWSVESTKVEAFEWKLGERGRITRALDEEVHLSLSQPGSYTYYGRLCPENPNSSSNCSAWVTATIVIGYGVKVAEFGDAVVGNSYNGCSFHKTHSNGGYGYRYTEYRIPCNTGTYSIAIEENTAQGSCRFISLSTGIDGLGSCTNWRVYDRDFNGTILTPAPAPIPTPTPAPTPAPTPVTTSGDVLFSGTCNGWECSGISSRCGREGGNWKQSGSAYQCIAK